VGLDRKKGDKLAAKQTQDHEKLQQQLEKEHQQASTKSITTLKTAEEQRHAQQTQHVEQKHDTQQKQMEQRQAPRQTAPKPQSRPPAEKPY
jgi:hypothetical protein